MSAIQIIGRRSSLFTRLPLIVAEELRVDYDLVPIYDMTELGRDVYAGNPALKLPSMRRGDSVLFGALNICRALAETAPHTANIVWPEQLRDDLSRNAQELVWHCMAAQVQIVMGTLVGKLPADNVFFVKTRTGIENSLQWLDTQLAPTFAALPTQRELSIFEASLFCLLEHLEWRRTMSIDAYASLREFTRKFAARPSARRTAYEFDTPPAT
jgi:glutathione S-transferase